MDTMDDAGVFRLSPDLALVQTVDFFFPIVNDPRTFGRIAAANSLSDIWAMGGRALTAMNLLGCPAGKIPIEAIEELLIGGSEKLQEAGVVLVGGHSLEQDYITYGLSVTGSVHPDKIKKNSQARAGDKLILTKPLGTDIFCDAYLKGGLSEERYSQFVASMERLNMYASEVFSDFDVSAMTDVTGFGLLGHALPLAKNAGKQLYIRASLVPRFDGTDELEKEFHHLQVCKCEEYIAPYLFKDPAVRDSSFALLAGSQTSGGLLAAVAPDQAEEILSALREKGDKAAAVIGEVRGLESDAVGKPAYLRLDP